MPPADERPYLSQLMTDLDPTIHNIILVFTGAFNPPHRAHLALLARAMSHLSALPTGPRILGTIISPSSDAYLAAKFPSPHTLRIPHALRCEMLRRGLAEAGMDSRVWVDTWEGTVEGGIPFPAYSVVVQEIQRLVGAGVETVFVCGEDVARRDAVLMGAWMEQKALVVAREAAGAGGKDGIFCRWWVEPPVAEVSSTDVRELLASERDRSDLEVLTFQSVAEMLTEHIHCLAGS